MPASILATVLSQLVFLYAVAAQTPEIYGTPVRCMMAGLSYDGPVPQNGPVRRQVCDSHMPSLPVHSTYGRRA